ncbi:MAG TPA: hypothetical protein VN812_01670, partial [Candidatus Acidoferrales bacterium]|nr:hypothetical protein [Candidatus Acidoferrales bacterium]
MYRRDDFQRGVGLHHRMAGGDGLLATLQSDAEQRAAELRPSGEHVHECLPRGKPDTDAEPDAFELTASSSTLSVAADDP